MICRPDDGGGGPIAWDPRVMLGKPVVRGTRITVELILERLGEGWTIADLLDAGVIFGTGFAPFTGGPITWLRNEGVDTVRERLQQLAQRYGDRFMPKRGWDNPALTSSVEV